MPSSDHQIALDFEAKTIQEVMKVIKDNAGMLSSIDTILLPSLRVATSAAVASVLSTATAQKVALGEHEKECKPQDIADAMGHVVAVIYMLMLPDGQKLSGVEAATLSLRVAMMLKSILPNKVISFDLLKR